MQALPRLASSRACCRLARRSLATVESHAAADLPTPERLAHRRATFEAKYAERLAQKARECVQRPAAHSDGRRKGADDWRKLAESARAARAPPIAKPKPPASQAPRSTSATPAPIKSTQQPTLASIIDVDRIRADGLEGPAIGNLWTAYHASKTTHLSAAIPSPIYARMAATARRYPEFVVPLSRGEGTEMWMLQWAATPVGMRTLFTPLAAFQTHGTYASPALALTHYEELERERGIVLMRGERTTDGAGAGLSQTDAQLLVVRTQRFYNAVEGSAEHDLLHVFHNEPQRFDVAELIRLSTAEVA